ncbi:MAG: ABC transporter ATP-binding protein [Planctomycetota bacterium]
MTQATTQNVEAPESGEAIAPSDDREIVVKALKLTKIFRDFWMRDKVRAVDAIDLEIYRGEVFGLLGPNGSGKSTTIKMILGLLHPTDGKLAVFGKLPRDVATKKIIGYLPEETYLYKFLTPIETLDYYGKLFHQDRTTRKNRIEMLLEMVGLEHAAKRPVGEFSKGMMRKVGLAQALINDPQLLILDEPTSGMDPIATADVKRVIQKLGERGKTVLLCSHLLADVQDVCDRVSMMYGGKIRRQGPIGSLLVEQEKTTITTPTLSNISDEQIVAALEQLGVTDVALDHPRRTLEQVFLDMVAEAKAEGARTSGAESGREVAAFLRGAGESPQPPATVEKQREVVIESLVSGAEESAEQETAPSQVAEPRTESASAAEAQADAVLADLTGEKPKQPEAKPRFQQAEPSKKEKKKTPPPPTSDKPQTDALTPDEADKGVIDDLLNG